MIASTRNQNGVYPFASPAGANRIAGIEGTRGATPNIPHIDDPSIPNIEDVDLSDPRNSGFMRVSPAGAMVVLKKNRNRPLRKVRALEYAAFMSSGQWQQDHPHGIMINLFGELRDGQHRLMGVVLSGVTVVMTVHCGVRDEVIEHTDTGGKRRLGDRLFFSSDKSVNAMVTGIVRLSICKAEGWRPRTLTVAESEEFIAAHADAIDFIVGVFARKRCRARVPALIALMEMYERNPEAARKFAAGLLDDTLTLGPQPAVKLQVYLAGVKGKGGSAMEREVYGKTVWACKAAIRGKEISKLVASVWDDQSATRTDRDASPRAGRLIP